MKLIEDKAENKRKIFYIYGGVETEEREQARAIVEKENDAIIVASYGTFLLVSILKIYII